MSNLQKILIGNGEYLSFDSAAETIGRLKPLGALQQLQTAPATAQETLERARLLFSLAQFEAALIALADLPDHAEAASLRRGCYYCLAQWAIETGDLARAEWASEQYLREDDGSCQSLATRGEVASLQGDDGTALEFFNRALAVVPRDYSVTDEQTAEFDRLLYLRIAALVRMRRYEESFDQWRQATQRTTDNADLWYLGAFCLVQLGRTAEGLPLLERALLIDPRHIDAGKLKRHLERERT